ncbi:MAG: magnesium transporter [Phycisphaerales bacterium]
MSTPTPDTQPAADSAAATIPRELEEAVLDAAVDSGDAPVCAQWLDQASTEQTVHAVSAMSADEQARLLALLPAESAAEVLEVLPMVQAAEAIEALGAVDHDKAADILEELSSDERADVFAAMDDAKAQAILGALPDAIADEVRRLSSYEQDAAGGLMLTEFLAFRDTMTVRDVLADMEQNAERYRDYNIQYSYVVDPHGALIGVIPIRRLLMAPRGTPVEQVMVKDPVAVADTTEFEDLQHTFDDNGFLALPVVDANGRLLGVVERSAVAEAAREDADDLYRASQGIVGGEELRSMPLTLRSRRRLAWLSINIVLNIMAASIIAVNSHTIEMFIALAVALPIISDMSGCSGNQAVAVSMRELTLGVTRPRDIFRVLFKECSVGIVNGCVLGVLIGLVAFLYQGDWAFSFVVGAALAANTVIAVCIGGGVPLLLKGLKTDPALASGPILTTVTDMCGFLIVLTLAAAVLTPPAAEEPQEDQNPAMSIPNQEVAAPALQGAALKGPLPWPALQPYPPNSPISPT